MPPGSIPAEIEFVQIWFYQLDAQTETIIVANQTIHILIDIEVEISGEKSLTLKTTINELSPMSTYDICYSKNQLYRATDLPGNLKVELKFEGQKYVFKQVGNFFKRVE